MARPRGGVTLLELLVALVLLTLVTAAVLRTSLALGRQSVAVAEHAAVQAGVRAGMVLARAELRELGSDAAGADILRLDPDSITFRAARGFGVTCAVWPSQIHILDAPPLPFSRLRNIAPGRDSLLLFVEGDSTTPTDDRWVTLPVLAVGSASCAGLRAIAVQTSDITALLPSGTTGGIVVGGLVRTFEVLRLAEYASGGQRWLGLASVSGGEPIQPLAGPLDGDGLSFEYLDHAGASVGDPAAVRSIRITLVGASERRAAIGWSGGPKAFIAETVSTRLFLRNVR
ncbi:MAG: prepilin-type N-terminal cleavage/methylation domain-containing protein [Gemmatimonadales bacterium]